jgi:hypothetical protein
MFEANQYAVVERALIVAYEIEPKNIPALRSRLGALQRGGLFGAERPGKGRKLGYGPDQFWRLVFALELTALGIAPSLILKLIAEFWDPTLVAVFREAERANMLPTNGGDIAFVLIGGETMFRATRDALTPQLSFAPLHELPGLMNSAMKDKPLPARSIVVNLTARLRRFNRALVSAQDLRDVAKATDRRKLATGKSRNG